jgi:hypothetical protein
MQAWTHRGGTHPGWHVLILFGAAAVAILGCRDHPGGWNDASRLATVESLVDRHTFVIDDSAFTKVTLDKLYINGHFYSDKSPVPAVLMAGPYWLWQRATGRTAASDGAGFYRLMTLTSSGLTYTIAVWCVFQLSGALRLGTLQRGIVTASFGLCTLAPVYAQNVNNHMPLLAIAAGLLLLLIGVAERKSVWRLYPFGLLAGLGYAFDSGAGLPLLLCVAGWVLLRFRAITPALVCAAGVLPFFALHHALNYSIGSTWRPANAVAEYFDYPGAVFSAQTMTGAWHHADAGSFLVYWLGLMFGKRGFIGHNLPLFLCLPGLVWLVRRRLNELPEALFGIAWIGGTWLLYGAASNNSGGECCSIRWFVPLLAPAYLVLALIVRERPEQFGVLLLLSAGGLLLSAGLVVQGPWTVRMVPYFWPVQATALVAWYWLDRRLAYETGQLAIDAAGEAPPLVHVEARAALVVRFANGAFRERRENCAALRPALTLRAGASCSPSLSTPLLHQPQAPARDRAPPNYRTALE